MIFMHQQVFLETFYTIVFRHILLLTNLINPNAALKKRMFILKKSMFIISYKPFHVFFI